MKVKSSEELQKELVAAKKELFNLRFQNATNQLNNTARIKEVWIKIFPDKPVTAKPAETRMGSGKGTVEYWVSVVKPGRVLFEIAGVDEAVAREALRLAMHKLPCKCKIISKADLDAQLGDAE